MPLAMNIFKTAFRLGFARPGVVSRYPSLITSTSTSTTTAIVTRSFAQTASLLARTKNDKFFKITKQSKHIDETVYHIGQDATEGVSIPKTVPQFPKYKYEALFMKRQNRGLYHGRQRKKSKTCSEFLNKNLRAHKPNRQVAKIWSEAMQRQFKVRVSTKFLRTMTKDGGLDQYLLKSTPGRIKTMGLLGWKMRYNLLNRLAELERGQAQVGNETKQITYIHKDGRKFLATREELLARLFEHVQRDSYYPLKSWQFDKEYSWLPMNEIVTKLDGYKNDFTGMVL